LQRSLRLNSYKNFSSASGNTLLHIDLDALEEIGGETGENEWGSQQCLHDT
jgi:hypothetical protein